jgi:4-amino-4-deoxy-L-arabinose transferase-like glycosyltransferase
MSAAPPNRPKSRLDLTLALLLLVATTGLLQLASRREGFARDEGYYFHAAEQHAAYYEELATRLAHGDGKALFDRGLIDRFFSYNNEHPPLLKTLFGLSWRLLHRCNCPSEAGMHALPYVKRHRTLGLLKNGEAMRLPAHALAGSLVAVVFLLGRRLFGRAGALAAAGLTILAPRHFFHAELSCFDAPVTAMLGLSTWAYLRAQQTRRLRWAVIAAVLFGLSLSTKHNAFFLPPLLLLHALWLRRDELRSGTGSKGQRWLRYLFQPWALAMATIGPLVYFLSWPYLWFDTVRRFTFYVSFHLHHVHYNIEYLGQNFNRPPYPWHYVPVMTLLTMPAVTLLLAKLGTIVWTWRSADVEAPIPDGEQRAGELPLLVLSAVWPLLIIMRPGTPIFGAEKHWLPAVPFLALLAGAAVAYLIRQVSESMRVQRLLAPLVVAVVLLPAALSVYRSHPYGLSHYSALAGGPVGAANLGMNRQFWGYSVRGVMPFLNQALLPHTPVYFHDANWFQLQMSQLDGFLRKDIADSGMEEPGVRSSRAALVMHEKHFNKYEYWIWDAYGTTKPSYVLTHQGVPLCTVYQRPDPDRGGK